MLLLKLEISGYLVIYTKNGSFWDVTYIIKVTINVLSLFLLKLQNATYFSPTPVSITTYLSKVSNEIVIHKAGNTGVFNERSLALFVNLGNLPDNRKWKLSFNLEYASFSINSSFSNFSKC